MKRRALLIVLLATTCNQMYASEALWRIAYRMLFNQEHFSRHQLYDNSFFDNEENRDRIVREGEYYVSLIEESIDKRIYVGSKANKSVNFLKLASGLLQLGGASSLIAGWYYYLKATKEPKYLAPVSLICTYMIYEGFFKTYKALTYKSRMKDKLERDLDVREKLRELTNQLPLLK